MLYNGADVMAKRKNKIAARKPYTEMTATELAKATREFDSEVRGRRLTAKDIALHEQAGLKVRGVKDYSASGSRWRSIQLA